MTSTVRATAAHAVLAAATYAMVLLATVTWGAVSQTGNDHLRGEMEQKSRLLAELTRRAAAQAPGPRSGGSAPVSGAAVSAPTETIAASELQRQMLERAESGGCVVHSVQAEPVKETAVGGLRRLVAQLSFDSSTTGLQRLLFDLEAGAPFMFVDSLVVQPTTASVPGTRQGDKLRVNLSVTSYWLTSQESEQARAP